MNTYDARKMVERISCGLDPYISRKLPVQDICSDEEVQEALRIVLDHCTIESDDQRRVRKKAEKIVERELKEQERHMRYPNGGKPWSGSEISELLAMHQKKYNIYQIANILKRTPSAIKRQLKNLGKKPVYHSK